MAEEDMEIVEGERCPFCMKETLTLMERVTEIPQFGMLHVFGMECQNDDCGYHVSDVEAEEARKAVKLEYTVESEDDLRVRVIKSAAATVKIPRMIEITPGPDTNGYVTNIEGLLSRFKKMLEELTTDDDKDAAKKAKSHLKKLNRVLWGREPLTIKIDDPTGNSDIVSDKTVRK